MYFTIPPQTLPRGFSLAGAAVQAGEGDSVFGLYGDLLNVRDYECDSTDLGRVCQVTAVLYCSQVQCMVNVLFCRRTISLIQNLIRSPTASARWTGASP